jgi:anaerobic magnesium-protoporphyrin IX monomethyl ester cyclase
MIDILLIRVSKDLVHGPVNDKYASFSPCILTGLLDAYIENEGFKSEIIDLEVDRYTPTELTAKLKNINPKWVGVLATGVNVSASTQSMPSVINLFNDVLLDLAKELNFKTFVYGGHPTVLPLRTLQETSADLVIIGEGYKTVTQLLGSQEDIDFNGINGLAFISSGQLVKTSSVELIDVNQLPVINWAKMDPKKYRAHNWHCFGDDLESRSPYGVIWTSMGCAYPCEFCCINNLYEKRVFRYRSMQSVVEEIDILVKDYGVKNLRIYDELFIMRHPRIKEFCDLLETRGYDLNIWCYSRADSVEPEILKRLKKVGVNWIGYGFEAGDDEKALKDINKKLRKTWEYTNTDIVNMTREAGINMIGHAILGLYEDDEAAIRRNMDFLKKHKFEWNNIYPAFAYPGTPFYKRYVGDGIIQEPESWTEYSLYGYDCKPLPTKHLTSAQVLELRDRLVVEYYSDPEIREDFIAKFGAKTMNHLDKMFSHRLPRKILGD